MIQVHYITNVKKMTWIELPGGRIPRSFLIPIYTTEMIWHKRQTICKNYTKVFIVEARNYVICDIWYM